MQNSKLLAFFAIPFAFGVGIYAADGAREFFRVLVGSTYPRCIDAGVCIGTPTPNALRWINTDKHGVTQLFCHGARTANNQMISIEELVAGQRCTGNEFSVVLGNPTTRTRLTFRNGQLIEIEEGPRHAFDP